MDRAGRGVAAPPPPIINDVDGSLVFRRGAGNQGGGGEDGKGKGGRNAGQEQQRGKGSQELFGHGCPNCGGPHNLHGCEESWNPTVTRVWRALGKPDANGGKRGGRGAPPGRGNGDGGRGGKNKGGRGYPPAEQPEAPAEDTRRRNGRRNQR